MTGLSAGQRYFIAVTAYNQYGESGYSNELNAVGLTTSVNPAGRGTVNPSGVTWYNSGQSVSVSATASSGYVFSAWSGDLSGSTNPSAVVMDRAKNVTANFTQNQVQYTLTVNIVPSGAGSVSKNPNKATYVQGEAVQLTATANAGYTFSNWSGDASGSTNPVTITMNANRAATANFTQNQYTLSVNISPAGAGSVTKNPNKATYVQGEAVQLTATANAGYTFSNWSGGASGSTNPVTITMNANSTVTANFVDPIQSLVTKYYIDILGRGPDPGGLAFWVSEINRIVSLGIDIEEGFIALGKLFFNSAEYVAPPGKSDTQYITDLYQTFLNRTPAQPEIDYWLGFLTQGLSREALLSNFAYSAEFQLYMESIFGVSTTRPENNLVNDFYRGFLNRLPDNAGFNAWLTQMRSAQCAGPQQVRDVSHQIALQFIQSAEYALRARNNSGYVDDLYNGILRRGADPAGFAYWRSFLDLGTYTREQLLQFFINSPEFQLTVQEVINAGCLP